MALLGSGALLLFFDVMPESVPEHDDWHTHEHLPERLGIPGFLRGSRWIATAPGQSRYLVLYEVTEPATLTSTAYLERLNHPSAWTSKMMPHYRGMTRGLCTVLGSAGLGLGRVAHALRFTPRAQTAVSLRRWLLDEVLPALPSRIGLGSVHLLEGAVAAPMTQEQRIRGADAGVDSVLLLTGYDPDAVSQCAGDLLASQPLQRGATGIIHGEYALHYVLASDEVDKA